MLGYEEVGDKWKSEKCGLGSQRWEEQGNLGRLLQNQESQEASGSKAISRHQQRLLKNLEIREVKIWKPICRAALKSGDSAGGGSEKVGVGGGNRRGWLLKFEPEKPRLVKSPSEAWEADRRRKYSNWWHLKWGIEKRILNPRNWVKVWKLMVTAERGSCGKP